ncbi:MAG: SpoIID/LytB domain-containing protein [Dermatophilaceae bacterium]
MTPHAPAAARESDGTPHELRSRLFCRTAGHSSAVLAAMVLAVALTSLAVLVGPAPNASAAERYLPPPEGYWRVDGHGFGHGRGLSQWGAYGAATQGVGYRSVLAHYYPDTTLVTQADSGVRVRLTVDSTQLRISASPGLTLTTAAGSTTLPAEYSQWRLLPDAGRLVLLGLGPDWQWRVVAINGMDNLPSGARVTNSESILRLWRGDGSSVDYRGTAVGYAVEGTMVTVLELPLEWYLWGVVPRESPASWPAEALRAQAVAVRSYAADNVRNPDSAYYDLCDTTACQVFGGTRAYSTLGVPTAMEQVSTTTAVNQTAGQVLIYGGNPILAEFSSSNGGWSAPGSRPYLQAQPDPWSGLAPGDGVHQWTARLYVSDLEARWPGIGRLTALTVTARNGYGDWGGRVLTVRLEGTLSSVVVTGEEIRFARPYPAHSDGLRSAWFVLTPPNVLPIGRLDAATWTGTGIHTYGWSLDPDTTDPVNVNVWIDNTGYSLVANTNRGDIANAYPAYGPNHGYDTTLPATPGPHRVCAYAINLPINGAAATLGCTTITVPDNPTPIGRLDAATWTGTGIHTYGWSLDPDTTDPVNVNVWIDNTGYSLVANTNRGDIANAYPAYGPNHGYDTTLPATPGPHRVCAYAINLPINGAAATLGCTTITVPDNPTPIGRLDAATWTGTGIHTYGWSLDPDTTDPVNVNVWIDNTGYSLVANTNRGDIANAYPAYGPNHGYDTTLPATPGPHRVCAYAINLPINGAAATLGCTTITVP